MNDQPATAQPEVTIEELIAAISHQIEVTHGGWVEFVDFDGKTLQVRLPGRMHWLSHVPANAGHGHRPVL